MSNSCDENVSNQLIDRFLIADEDSDLYLLMLSKGRVTTTGGPTVSKLTIERLGKTSSSHKLSGQQRFFIGSVRRFSNHQTTHRTSQYYDVRFERTTKLHRSHGGVHKSWSYRRLLRYGFRTSWSRSTCHAVQESAREDLCASFGMELESGNKPRFQFQESRVSIRASGTKRRISILI